MKKHNVFSTKSQAKKPAGKAVPLYDTDFAVLHLDKVTIGIDACKENCDLLTAMQRNRLRLYAAWDAYHNRPENCSTEEKRRLWLRVEENATSDFFSIIDSSRGAKSEIYDNPGLPFLLFMSTFSTEDQHGVKHFHWTLTFTDDLKWTCPSNKRGGPVHPYGPQIRIYIRGGADHIQDLPNLKNERSLTPMNVTEHEYADAIRKARETFKGKPHTAAELETAMETAQDDVRAKAVQKEQIFHFMRAALFPTWEEQQAIAPDRKYLAKITFTNENIQSWVDYQRAIFYHIGMLISAGLKLTLLYAELALDTLNAKIGRRLINYRCPARFNHRNVMHIRKDYPVTLPDGTVRVIKDVGIMGPVKKPDGQYYGWDRRSRFETRPLTERPHGGTRQLYSYLKSFFTRGPKGIGRSAQLYRTEERFFSKILRHFEKKWRLTHETFEDFCLDKSDTKRPTWADCINGQWVPRDDPASKAAWAQHQQWRRKEARDEWEQSQLDLPLVLLRELLKRGSEFFHFKKLHLAKLRSIIKVPLNLGLNSYTTIGQLYLLHKAGIPRPVVRQCLIDVPRPEIVTALPAGDFPFLDDYVIHRYQEGNCEGHPHVRASGETEKGAAYLVGK